MSLKDKIDNDIKQAMLSKNADELRALRAIKAMILLAETEKGGDSQLNEESELKLLSKALKQRKESGELFKKEGREDLFAKENSEIETINKYLPEQLSDEQLKSELEKIIENFQATEMKDMGKVMGIASKQFAGIADGKKISIIVKSLLS